MQLLNEKIFFKCHLKTFSRVSKIVVFIQKIFQTIRQSIDPSLRNPFYDNKTSMGTQISDTYIKDICIRKANKPEIDERNFEIFSITTYWNLGMFRDE